MDHRLLGELEGGVRLPNPNVLESLRRVMGEDFSLPTPMAADIKKLARRIATPRPYDLECGYEYTWERAYSVHRELIAQLQPTPEVPAWFRDTTRLDSGEEGLGWLQFFADGAIAALGSPQELGLRSQPALDSKHQCLGERSLPYLIWKGKEVSALLWPQLSLKAGHLIYRPDAVGLVRIRSRRRLEVMLEFDGGGHNFSRDKQRSTQIAQV